MATTKKRTIQRLSCYFEYGQSKAFEIDLKRGDKLIQTPKEIKITRRSPETEITIDRAKLAYSVLSTVVVEADPSGHPAFQNPESEDIEFRG